jgi:hypothetical protein
MYAAKWAEASVSDIFTEVDEELRREQLKKLWERYGNYVIAAAFAVILGVAAYRGYEWWQNKKATEAGAAYDAAAQLAEAGKHEEAEAAFGKLTTEGTAGYRILARLRQAAEIAERDPTAAVAAYDAIARDNAGEPLVGELAAVRAAFLLVDTAKLDEMVQRLDPVTQPKGTFRHTARELLALSAWHNGDAGATRRWTDAAKSDPEAPPALRSRMEVLTTLLPEAGKP